LWITRTRTERGYTLIEMVVAMAIVIPITFATFALLEAATRSQARDQSYAQEVTSTQTALARLTHDLRQATSFQLGAITSRSMPPGATERPAPQCTCPGIWQSGFL
jgi:type II secretory pathway component PulJ